MFQEDVAHMNFTCNEKKTHYSKQGLVMASSASHIKAMPNNLCGGNFTVVSGLYLLTMTVAYLDYFQQRY